MSGIIRPKGETVEDGFDILTLDYFFGMDLWDKTFPYAAKSDIEFDVVETKEVNLRETNRITVNIQNMHTALGVIPT